MVSELATKLICRLVSQAATPVSMIDVYHIWCVVGATDMRCGIDGLSQQIQTGLGQTPCDGTAYAFSNQRGNRLKLLIWDGTGV